MVEEADFDELDFEQFLEDGDAGESVQQRKRKKRVRNWTAEDRARHRVFERSRREAFNERLNELAGLLPSLKNAKDTQLSKHVIVDESVKQHHAQQATISEMTQALDELKAQHQELLKEVSAWRQTCSLPQWKPGGSSSSGEAAGSLGGPTTATLIPGAGLPSNAGDPLPHDRLGGVAEMRQYAASRPSRSLLPDLGTYPDNLVQLPPDPTSTSVGAPGSSQLVESTRELGNFEMQQQPPDAIATFATGSQASFHDPRLRRLFGRFQDPSFVSGEHHAQQSAPSTFGMQNLSATQWPQSPSANWMQAGYPPEYGELDLNTIYFRNNPAVMNV